MHSLAAVEGGKNARMRLDLTPSDSLNLERDDEWASAMERNAKGLEAQAAEIRAQIHARRDSTFDAIIRSAKPSLDPPNTALRIERDAKGHPVAIVWEEPKAAPMPVKEDK